jgi:DNA-binding NarL/FixJ family response regulator
VGRNPRGIVALQQGQCLPLTLILTTFDEENLVIRALQAGARGFLLKDVSLEQLTDAIRTLAAGRTMVQPVVTERLRQQRQRVPCDFRVWPPPRPSAHENWRSFASWRAVAATGRSATHWRSPKAP